MLASLQTWTRPFNREENHSIDSAYGSGSDPSPHDQYPQHPTAEGRKKGQLWL